MKSQRYLLSLLLLFSTITSRADWQGDKYSMFIHYGLYSIPGGVFNEQRVERGYSEQILTFGIGFSDWYEAYAREFTAENFEPEEIVALAKAGGMRSIVITSKHHDGFCLFDTETTDYNSVKSTPAGRDLLKELSDVCHREGIGFGIYFSLIDWNYPYAVPFSSHNADRITPPHHEYNKAQVTELLTKYGQVDELWFDMGSLSTEQSAELYDLVHSLQPDCMVSGRLGNDYADFSVMADNEYPDYLMQMPWQTAASMFDETWGYRSWQERGNVEAKVQEKLNALIKVVAYGGKYLLNIGPRGDGSIVDFEAEVIKRIGEEIEPIQEAIYNTIPAPLTLTEDSPLMTMSLDGKTLYLFRPHPDTISLASLFHPSLIKKVEVLGRNSYYTIDKITFHDPIKASNTQVATQQLTPLNAEPLFAHSSADYYASFKSIVGYKWNTTSDKQLLLTYTDAEKGRTILLNGEPVTLSPDKENPTYISSTLYSFGALYSTPQRGRLANISNIHSSDWILLDYDLLHNRVERSLGFSQGELFRQQITAKEALDLPMSIEYKDGIIIYLNGTYIDGAWTRKEEGDQLNILLPLSKGDNEMMIKLYNRWGNDSYLQVNIPQNYRHCEQLIDLPEGITEVIVTKEQKQPLASPAHLSTLRIMCR